MRSRWIGRDDASPHENAGHRFIGNGRIHSAPNDAGELYPVYSEQEWERGSEEEENSLYANFQQHLRRGHEAERIRR